MRTTLLRLLCAPLLLVLLSGCIDATQHLTVHSDGSAVIQDTLLVDNTLLAASGTSLDSQLASMKAQAAQAKPHATITIIKTQKQSGLRYIESFKTVDAALASMHAAPASSSAATASGAFSTAQRTTSGGADHYTFVYTPSDGTSAPSSATTTPLPGGSVTFVFSLTLPTQVAHASGSPTYSDDRHTVAYNLAIDHPTTITIDATPPFPWTTLIFILVMAVIVVLAGLWFFMRPKATPPPPGYTLPPPAAVLPSAFDPAPLPPGASASEPPAPAAISSLRFADRVGLLLDRIHDASSIAEVHSVQQEFSALVQAHKRTLLARRSARLVA